MTKQGHRHVSYREAIAWIAQNDEPSDLDVDNVAGYISTTLIADLWRKDPIEVATAVVRKREQLGLGADDHGMTS